MLQDLLVNKQGEPLANGVVKFFSNTARTTYKNVYYQSGTVETYDYIPLPNPLTLSAAGTIVDITGADVILGFYPLSETDNTTPETYFIQVYDQFGTLQFTRFNFPIQPTGGTPTSGEQDIKQLIINNRFWRNIGSATLTNVGSMIVAPDQHDGYSTGLAGASSVPVNGYLTDITFNKNATGSAESVTFTKFPLQSSPVLTDDITPEFYLNHVATSTSGSETLKYYQFPISLHLRTLSAVEACVSIQAKGNASITLSIFQFQGTGQASTTPTPFKTIPLTSSWTKYTSTFEFPPDFGTTIDGSSAVGDDALYLWVGLPASTTCDISFTLPSVYLINNIDEIPINDFRNYDEVNAIISSPRTGDVKTSLNYFVPFGWIQMNDETIGSASSGATTRANSDTWPLYNLIWNKVSDTYAPVSGGRGASAYADFIANKTIALTKALGQVFAGTTPGSVALGTTAGASTQTLSISNMPAHNHPGSTVAMTNSGLTGQNIGGLVQLGGSTAITVASQGSGAPFDIIQPTIYMNFIIKL